MIKNIIISQPKPANGKSPYFELAEKMDLNVTFHPFIKVERLSATEFRKQKIRVLDHTAIVFNSRHSINHFFTLCKDLRVAIPDDMKYFCISEPVSLYIQHHVTYRKRKVFFGSTGKFPELVQVMAKHKNEKYLIVQSDVRSEEFGQLLDAKKLHYTDAIMYRTVANDIPFNVADYDMVLLFTPSGVDSLQKHSPDLAQGNLQISCWGEAAQKAAEEAGFRVDLKAPTPETPSMVACLEKFLLEKNK